MRTSKHLVRKMDRLANKFYKAVFAQKKIQSGIDAVKDIQGYASGIDVVMNTFMDFLMRRVLGKNFRGAPMTFFFYPVKEGLAVHSAFPPKMWTRQQFKDLLLFCAENSKNIADAFFKEEVE